jgi:hypothetical protein
MMATVGSKHVRWFMYFYIKQVTLVGTIMFFSIQIHVTVKILSSFVLRVVWSQLENG